MLSQFLQLLGIHLHANFKLSKTRIPAGLRVFKVLCWCRSPSQISPTALQKQHVNMNNTNIKKSALKSFHRLSLVERRSQLSVSSPLTFIEDDGSHLRDSLPSSRRSKELSKSLGHLSIKGSTTSHYPLTKSRQLSSWCSFAFVLRNAGSHEDQPAGFAEKKIYVSNGESSSTSLCNKRNTIFELVSTPRALYWTLLESDKFI